MNKNLAVELAIVTAVGFGFAQASKRIPILNDNTMFTRTMLYTRGNKRTAALCPVRSTA